LLGFGQSSSLYNLKGRNLTIYFQVKLPPTPLLPQRVDEKPTLVLDLDETLVHTSSSPGPGVDFVLTYSSCSVYVAKRPHVDEFLRRMSLDYELVLFTASLAHYANEVADRLDPTGEIFSARLFRPSCVFYEGNYVKDLRVLERPLKRVAIIDNSSAAYYFQPRNAIVITTWMDNPMDTELSRLIPFLEKLAKTDSFYYFLRHPNHRYIH